MIWVLEQEGKPADGDVKKISFATFSSWFSDCTQCFLSLYFDKIAMKLDTLGKNCDNSHIIFSFHCAAENAGQDVGDDLCSSSSSRKGEDNRYI